MLTYQINWARLRFLQMVNATLSIISFAICIAIWILFGFGYAVGIFLALSVLIAVAYRIAFGFSTLYSYYLWFRRGRGHMAEYVARSMHIVEEVELPHDFPSGVARSFGLNNASLANAREVNVGLTNV